MQPIKMTRAEYEASIGSLPESKLDISPAPMRMTREEYEQQFGSLPRTLTSTAQRNRLAGIQTPEMSFRQDLQADIALQGQRQSDILQQDEQSINRIFERVGAGEISPAKGTFQSIGRRALTAGQIAAEGARGIAKMILPEAAEQEIAEFNQFMQEGFIDYNSRYFQRLQETEPERAETLQEISDLYQNDETFRADVDATIGIGGVVANLFGGGGARAISPDVGDIRTPSLNTVRQSVIEAGSKLRVISDERIVNNIADDIYSIERKYAQSRKALAQSKDEGAASRTRIAESNVLDGSVDEDGVIKTLGQGGAYERYKQQTIGDSENIVRRSLVQEGEIANLADLQNFVKNALMQSNLSGSDLVKALNGVEQEIKGLAIRADQDGNVPLYTVHDSKVSMYEHIDYNSDPETRIYRTTLANAYKRFVEDNSSVNVGEINAELGKFYDDLSRLKMLDGKRVQGGKLGRYASQIVGTAAGTAVGSFGGPVGGAVGALIGADLGSRLRSFQMQRVFRGRDRDFSPNAVLDSAKLRISDSPIEPAMLAGIEITPEIENILFQINQNVILQERAIKAGDLVRVKALKEIYSTLVRKLDDQIYRSDSLNIDQNIDTNAANKNASPTGIQDNNTPESSAVNTAAVESPDDLFEPKSVLQRIKETLRNQRGSLSTGDTAQSRLNSRAESRIDYTKLSQKGLDQVAAFLAHVDGDKPLDLIDYDTVRRSIDTIAGGAGIDPSLPDSQIASKLADKYAGQISGRIPAATTVNESDVNPSATTKTTDLPNTQYKNKELNFVYNTKKADLGNQDFAQNVEPAGRYMNVGFDEFTGGEGMVKGTVTFKNPLVIDWETSRTGGWKTKLSERYGGKTGNELSQAVIDDGYDGIIAVTDDIPKEAVNLQTFRGTTDLIEEARKYDSAEEFINAQGTPVFHATDSNVFDPTDFDVSKAAKGEQYFNPLGQGMYVSSNKDFVKRFGKNRMELVLPSDAKIKTIAQDEWLGGYGRNLVDEAFKEMGGKPSSITDTELNRVVRNAPIDALNQVDSLISQKEGMDVADKFVEALNKVQTKRNSQFDAIKYEATDYAFDADEIVIPDPSKLKTRTQLEDIWKQANAQ